MCSRNSFVKNRSSRPEVLCKKSVCRPEACNFIKKRFWHRCFPVNFVKFLRTPFFIEHPPVAASERRYFEVDYQKSSKKSIFMFAFELSHFFCTLFLTAKRSIELAISPSLGCQTCSELFCF